MKATSMFFYFWALFIVTGCTTDHNPFQTDNYIDPKIIGTWYMIDPIEVIGQPDFSVSGFQISKDGFMYNIGVEIKTGNLIKYSDTNYSSQIISTRKGEMEVYAQKNGMIPERTYFCKYDVNDSNLTFYYDGGGSSIYKKSKIGNNANDPVVSEFFTIIDSDTFSNAVVWRNPSAYFGYSYYDVDSLVHEIYATSGFNSGILIQLNNFEGIVTYTLGVGNEGMAHFFQGYCAIAVYFTEQPNSGYVIINEYDLQNNVCSGTFEFYVSDHDKEFSEGRFRIPIYN